MATVTRVATQYSSVETMIITHESMLEKGLHELLSRLMKIEDAVRVVGLELFSAFYSIGDVGKKNKVAVLALCSNRYCLIIQLIHFRTIPPCLASFLDQSDVTFVGIGIQENLIKLRRDYELECRNGIELGPLSCVSDNYYPSTLSRVSGNYSPSIVYRRACGLLRLVKIVLEISLGDKPASVVFSDWGTGELTEEQIKHATVDAYACFSLGYKILAGKFNKHEF